MYFTSVMLIPQVWTRLKSYMCTLFQVYIPLKLVCDANSHLKIEPLNIMICWKQAHLEGMLITINTGLCALMPTLPDYPGVSRIRNESPGLPYGWSILPDKYDFEPFLLTLFHSTLKTHPQVERISIFEIVLPFLNAFQHLRLSNTLNVDRN